MVLVSGNGTNLQALINAEQERRLGPGTIAAVLSDKPWVYALARAEAAGIPVFTEVSNKKLPRHEQRQDLSGRILETAANTGIDLIILAGFLSILEGNIIKQYAGRIINIHPSLLPKYGGMGMYGERVHRAVLEAGETESGCSVHLVDAGTDTGPVLLQRKVPVLPDDTADGLAERVHREEYIAIVDAAITMVKKIIAERQGRL
ncbi:phosphoribosylglycinamide formyltransferase [Treponema sp. OttesenSCG-928-L16]|nr:phosphoribosylglycinamide formyltransferase [Treponema sp. OttesenSCG-928-L16]